MDMCILWRAVPWTCRIAEASGVAFVKRSWYYE